jgi:hypothetical protein
MIVPVGGAAASTGLSANIGFASSGTKPTVISPVAVTGELAAIHTRLGPSDTRLDQGGYRSI